MFMLDNRHQADMPNLVVQWITYTPELARWILEIHNENNRPFKPKMISKMVRAMTWDKFSNTHQGVAFSPAGKLLDGQNRMKAIVISGKSQTLLTVFGVPDRAQKDMDCGSNRTQGERLKFGCGIEVDRQAVACINIMSSQGLRTDLLPDEQEAFYSTHKTAIDFAIANASDATARGGCMAIIARATYTVDLGILREFCRIAKGGHFSPGEESASVFGRTKMKPTEVYPLAQRALMNFIRGRSTQYLRPLYGNHFPLPGEVADPVPREYQLSAASEIFRKEAV